MKEKKKNRAGTYSERFDESRGEISSNFRENKERKSPNFVCISFEQYCKSSNWYFARKHVPENRF